MSKKKKIGLDIYFENSFKKKWEKTYSLTKEKRNTVYDEYHHPVVKFYTSQLWTNSITALKIPHVDHDHLIIML